MKQWKPLGPSKTGCTPDIRGVLHTGRRRLIRRRWDGAHDWLLHGPTWKGRLRSQVKGSKSPVECTMASCLPEIWIYAGKTNPLPRRSEKKLEVSTDLRHQKGVHRFFPSFAPQSFKIGRLTSPQNFNSFLTSSVLYASAQVFFRLSQWCTDLAVSAQ